MDSQLALVLTNGNLDNANGSQHLEKLANKATVDPGKNFPLGSPTGIVQPCAVLRAVTSMGDGLPDVGGTSRPASQEMGESGGFKQPIIVKTGVPLMRNQPIRLKIVVPPRCKGPNSNSPASVTKNPPNIQFTPAAVSAGIVLNGLTAETNTSKTPTAPVLFSVLSDKETKERKNTREPKVESCPRMVEGEENQRHVTADQTGSANTNDSIVSQTAAPSTSDPPSLLGQPGTPPSLLGQPGTPGARADCRATDRPAEAEQTEPLDLSLPRRRDGNEGRCSRFLDDSGCGESSLIMEVDEYEGEGDRDVVEEDDDDDDALGDSLLSPALLPASPPLSALHHGDNKLLLIDDQGIPYTLSSDGHKVPQINPLQGQDPPPAVPVVPTSTAEVRGAQIPQPATSGGSDPDQGFDSALHAPGATPASIDDSSSAGDGLPEAAVVKSTQLPACPLALEPCAGAANEANEACAALPQLPGTALTGQPIQILSTSSSSAPILLLAATTTTTTTTPSSSLPISTGTSSHVLLLLSSVLSSSDQPLPLAVLDPSTGQLSQLTSHPVIRVGPNHGPVILSGAGASVSPFSPPSVSPCPPAPTAPLHAETKAMSAGESPDEDAQPSPQATATPSPPSPRPTFDPSNFNRSPSPEPTFDPPDLRSELLEDHLYFSSSAAPPTPPAPPSLSSSQLDPPDPLDPLDPLSPAASPNSMGPRRVLYCKLCPRVFFYLSDLERHAITHSQKKPHVCQQCGKAFKRSSHLQRHKHIHTGQRNYLCPICAKRFREAGELQRHQRVHTGEKPYQCQLCHTRFAERNTLRRHTKRKHPFHQVAMEMLSERRGGRAVAGGGGVMQEEEESAEWYSSTVSNFDNSESEMDT